MAKQHTEDVITSEEDIKSNARTQTSDPTKGQDIQSARTGASYRGDDYSFPTTPTIGNWQMPMVRGASFQEVIDNDLGDIMAENALEENTFSPSSEYGNSWYDQFVRGEEGYKNLNEVRAMEQGLTSKIVSGSLGFVGKTTSSFVGTFVSAIAGIGQGIMNVADDDPNTTFMQGFVKNGFQEVADDWNTWWDNVVPNYKGREYEEKNMFSKLFTATYWADQLNNMGFTTGTLLGVMASGGMGGAGLAAKLATSPKSVQLLYRLFSGAVAAIPEATMEGYQLYKEAREKYQQELEPKVQQCNQELQQLEQAMQQIENMYHPFGNGEGIIRIEEKEREYNEMMSALRSKYDAIKNERDNIYNDAEKRALDAGVMNTVQQMPLLTLSNSMGMMSWLRCPTMNANRMVQGAFGNAFRKTGTKKGISLGEARATAVREMLSEGTEEWMQAYSSNLAMDYYGSDYDPKSAHNFARYLHTAAESFKNTAMDESAWEEALAGCIMGATGAIAPHRGSDGKMHIFQGGIRESWREAKDLSERSQKTYDAMNDVINNPEARNNAKLAIAHLSLLNKQMEMAGTGSTDKEYRDYSNMLAIKTIQNFANAGRLNDLDALVGDNVDLSDEELVKLSKMFYQKGQESLFSDENGENMAEGSKEQRDALRDKIKQRHSDMKRMIKDYRDAINEVDKMTGWQLGQDQLNMLTWAVTQQKNWKNRIKDMYDLPEFQDMLKTISANNQQLMEAAQRAEIQREKDIQSKKMTSRSMQVVEQAMNERGQYLDQMYDASLAFIEKRAQEIERESAELERQAQEWENTGQAFAESNRRQRTKEQVKELKKIREIQAKIESLKKKYETAKKDESYYGKWYASKQFQEEYQKALNDLLSSIESLENQQARSELKREYLKEAKKQETNDILQQAQGRADEARMQSWEKQEEADKYRTEETERFKESGEYTKETDEKYKEREGRFNSLKAKINYLEGLIQQANETITQGEKARENEESVENIKSMGVLDAKSLEELMHRINSGNLLMQMTDAKNVNLFDQIAELTELLEEGAADPEDIKRFKNLLSDMKKCMHSYIATDKLTKQFVANPNNIKILQDKVKNNVASEMAKQTVEDMNETFEDISDKELTIDDNDRLEDGFSRLNEQQLVELSERYKQAVEEAKKSLETQLMVLGWDKDKREKYAEKVVNKAIRQRRQKNENFDEFMTAMELSEQFSEMFDEIIENINLQGIPLAEIKTFARQIFDTANLFAFSHNFHPTFLSNNDVANLLQSMGYDIMNDPKASAAFVCTMRIYNAMNKNLRRAKANSNTSPNINDGKIRDLNTGQAHTIDNPDDKQTSNDVTRDGTAQITGVTVLGDLDDVIILTDNNPIVSIPPIQPTDDGQGGEQGDGETNPNNPPMPPVTPVRTQPENPLTEDKDKDKKSKVFPFGAFSLNRMFDPAAVTNRRTKVSRENSPAEHQMDVNKVYQYIYQGGLKKLLEKEKKVDVYANRIEGIGTEDNPVVFFYVKDNGKFQMIGYIANQTASEHTHSYMEHLLIFAGIANKETGGAVYKEAERKGTYKTVASDEPVRVNINPKNQSITTGEPQLVKNIDDQPLRILKVVNSNKEITGESKTVSEIPVCQETFDEALDNGNVGIIWGGALIGKDIDHKVESKDTAPSIVYKDANGEFHRCYVEGKKYGSTGVKAKPVIEVLSDETNSMTKVFKKALKDLFEGVLGKQANGTYLSNNALEDAMEEAFSKFMGDNMYGGEKFKSTTDKGLLYRPLTTATLSKDGYSMHIKLYTKNKNAAPNTLLEFDINIENNSDNQSEEEYYNNIAEQAFTHLKNIEQMPNDRDSKYIAIRLNKAYADEYDPKDVAKCLTSTLSNFQRVNCSVCLTYKDADSEYNHDEIAFNEVWKTDETKTLSSNKIQNKITIGNQTFYFTQDRNDNNQPVSSWTPRFGKAEKKDQDNLELYPYNPILFLEQFDPDGILGGSEDKLNEVLTYLFSNRSKINKITETYKYVKMPHGVWDASTGQLISEQDCDDTIAKVEDIYKEEKQEQGNVPPVTDTMTQTQTTQQQSNGEKREEKREEKKDTLDDLLDGTDSDKDYDGDYDYPSEVTRTEKDKNIKIQNGLHSGILLFKQVMSQMSSKFSQLDEQLIDFIQANLDPRLTVKVLDDSQWAKFVELNPSKAGAIGVYSPQKNCIYLRTLTDAVTLVHEFAHAATVKALNEAMNKDTSTLSELNEILTYLKSKYREHPEMFTGIKGIENFNKNNKDDLFEMVAEIIGNKDLQGLLRRQSAGTKTIQVTERMEIKETKPKSLLDKLFNWIKRLFRANNPRYEIRTTDKLVEYTMFDKFKENATKFGNRQRTKSTNVIQKTKNKINNKTRRKSYKVNFEDSINGITTYNSLALTNAQGVEVNVEKFLNKFNYDGTPNATWSNLVTDFENRNDVTLNFLDTSDNGKKTQRKFYDYLKERGYEGIDLITGRDLAFSRYASDEILISFKEHKTDKQIADSMGIPVEEVGNISESSRETLKHCF